MNIAGECKVCGYIFDPTVVGECPACRATNVAKAFAPVDPLRTALGVGGKRPKTAEEWKALRDEYVWESIRRVANSNRILALHRDKEALTEVPEGCKMPRDEAAQVYELQRLFRLTLSSLDRGHQ